MNLSRDILVQMEAAGGFRAVTLGGRPERIDMRINHPMSGPFDAPVDRFLWQPAHVSPAAMRSVGADQLRERSAQLDRWARCRTEC